MSLKEKRQFHRLIRLINSLVYPTITMFGVVLFGLVHYNYLQNQKVNTAAYRAESYSELKDVAGDAEDTFSQTYQTLQTVARLPGIRELPHRDTSNIKFHNGEGLESNTQTTIQELYHNLASRFDVSELYIVPLNLDPDAPADDTTKAREPLATFDHLIVDHTADQNAGAYDLSEEEEEEEDEEIEEIEIYEYRMMRDQLKWMKSHYPNKDLFSGLMYPMVGGPQVVTCDNTCYSSLNPDDQDRSGLVLSIPFYDKGGLLGGCVSAIILTHALSDLLPNGNYAIINPDYGYLVPPNGGGQWRLSYDDAVKAEPDKGLIFSNIYSLDTGDMGGSWFMWAGQPDSMFWERTDVKATVSLRNLAYGFVAGLTLMSLFGAWLVLRNQKVVIELNRGLEQSVRDRTKDLEGVINELKDQRYAIDEHSIVSITDIRGNIVYANDRFCHISGYTQEELIGQNHRIIKSDEHSKEFYRDMWKTVVQDGIWHGEIKNRHKDGSFYWVDATIAPYKTELGKEKQYIAIRTDITGIKHAQEYLRRISEHDPLTGLPNRELFHTRLQEVIDVVADNPDNKFAVLFFDFDRFKVVNDSLGHKVGDALLEAIAEKFRRHVRDCDLASRFGGDEFVVLLNELEDYQEARQAADRLLNTFVKSHELFGHSVTSTASIGLVTNTQGYSRAEDMIRDADAAMYQAKEAGKARVVEFDQAMHQSALDRLNLENDLRKALSGNEMRVVYQPIVELATGEIKGFEALVRWDHPDRGTISPVDFIPIAEDTGLIIPIGQWILTEACKQLRHWNRDIQPRSPISMNVNLSMRQVCHPDVIEMIKQAITDTGIEPGWLKLEITESDIIDDRHDMIPLLTEIRDLGIELAMDDFGTGHSSLSNLHCLPIDVLKIDQSFINSMSANRELAAVMQAIITVAHHLGMTTVAEGIETVEQLVLLQALDCDCGQGYYFQKPLSSSEALDYLRGADRDQASAS